MGESKRKQKSAAQEAWDKAQMKKLDLDAEQPGSPMFLLSEQYKQYLAIQTASPNTLGTQWGGTAQPMGSGGFVVPIGNGTAVGTAGYVIPAPHARPLREMLRDVVVLFARAGYLLERFEDRDCLMLMHAETKARYEIDMLTLENMTFYGTDPMDVARRIVAIAGIARGLV